MQEVHSKGIVHRDIKPENLIFGDNSFDSIKITDFGLSTKIREGHKLTMRCGTPGFVAPELMNNEGYDQKADLFSVGILMYQLLTGS